MYCPLCGGKLTQIEKKDPTEGWGFDDPRWGTYEENYSIECELPTGLACRLPLGGYAANKALYSGSPCPI